VNERTMNIQQMMKQAQQMQERLQKQMAELKVEASAAAAWSRGRQRRQAECSR
jgi:DNA-binding protein YbaB